MPKPKPWLTSSLLLTFDAVAIYTTFRLAIMVRRALSPFLAHPSFIWGINDLLPIIQFGLLFLLVIFFLQGLYPGYGLTAVKELEKMGRAISLSFVLLATISYLNKPLQVFPRSILLIAWGMAMVSLPLMRFLLRNILSRQAWYGNSVTIFGEAGWRDEVKNTLKRVRRLGWRPQATFPYSEIQGFDHTQARNHIAVLAPSPETRVENYVRLLNQHFRKVIVVRQSDNIGSLWVVPRDLDGYLGLEYQNHLLVRRNLWVKRAIDVLGSAFLLILLSPFFLLVALLIKINNPGPVFFKHERIGRNFIPFHVLKFRTMVTNAEQRLQEVLANSPELRMEFEQYHKLMNDPRITKVGKFLRITHLDELPQLWNVLRGEMSLIGPRPVVDKEVKQMGDYAASILCVRPGMTGWWQVMGKHKINYDERVQMEEYYISNWSLWMDGYIFLKTVFVVLSGSGA